MKLRSDPEAIEAYRDMLLKHLGIETSDMSDEEVHKKMEVLIANIIRAGAHAARAINQAFNNMMPAIQAVVGLLERLQTIEKEDDGNTSESI